jgi:tetratricopeptide (TPR) repeat protein
MRKTVFIIIIVAFFFLTPIAHAALPEVLSSLTAKLDSEEVEVAWSEVNTHLINEPKNPELLELASEIAFHRGEYQEALKLMKSAIEVGGEEEKRKVFALFIEQTLGVITSLKKFESPHFLIMLDEKQEGFLSSYIIDALETTYQVMARHYGFEPKEKIRVEIFPDTKTFYYASSLSARDIEIGAVGLAKFNKLMLLSPAALVHGYRWLDAISHEYMHYLIVKLTANKAPIWFHEGLAKYEETQWRKGPSYLSSPFETLLAHALTERKLIPFEKMEPSVVRLETPEEVQLAYVEAASAIEFIIAKAGQEGLKEIMKRMATQNSKGASESIQEVLGLTFDEFERDWKGFLTTKGLMERSGANIRHYKIKEGKADEERLDMEEIKSLVARNRAHLADLLREKGRKGAAVLEYRRALHENPDSVPILNKISSCLIGMDRDGEAREFLTRAKELAPDHPAPYTYLGQSYLKLKDFKKAKESFSESVQINPFDPEAHQGLAQAYEMLGEKGAAHKEQEIADKLKR